ncbi:MAG: hypothetical protein ACAI25_11825 [Planctomycetota bacterium]
MCDAHNGVDVPRITFGDVKTHRVPAELELRFDFESERTGFRNCSTRLETRLSFEGVYLEAPNLVAARRIAKRFVDLEEFERPVRSGHFYTLDPAKR